MRIGPFTHWNAEANKELKASTALTIVCYILDVCVWLWIILAILYVFLV